MDNLTHLVLYLNKSDREGLYFLRNIQFSKRLVSLYLYISQLSHGDLCSVWNYLHFPASLEDLDLSFYITDIDLSQEDYERARKWCNIIGKIKKISLTFSYGMLFTLNELIKLFPCFLEMIHEDMMAFCLKAIPAGSILGKYSVVPLDTKLLLEKLEIAKSLKVFTLGIPCYIDFQITTVNFCSIKIEDVTLALLGGNSLQNFLMLLDKSHVRRFSVQGIPIDSLQAEFLLATLGEMLNLNELYLELKVSQKVVDLNIGRIWDILKGDQVLNKISIIFDGDIYLPKAKCISQIGRAHV